MRSRIAATCLIVALAAASGPARAAPAAGPAGAAARSKLKGKSVPSKARAVQVPLAAGEKAGWSHGPYEAGDCGICHQKNDPKSPGPLVKGGNELCYSCHEEFADIMARKFKHPPAAENCNNCHNPHNSKEKKLLVAEQTAMCYECHADIKAIAEKSKVKHDALTTGAKCSNCHNPHAANVERMLVQLPFDLCVSCHSRDGVSDGRGGFLTNFKKWLDQNRIWHEPVKAKDCSACHKTHGGEYFRLLVAEYPRSFYAPYEPKAYALCYACHNDKVVSEPETTTLTSFRDGPRNLHFVHVNKAERGRTCRACHEVHASNQDHHVRDGVPYGPKGWILKLNYTRTPTGGACAKTCHETKTYTNRAAAGGPVKKK